MNLIRFLIQSYCHSTVSCASSSAACVSEISCSFSEILLSSSSSVLLTSSRLSFSLESSPCRELRSPCIPWIFSFVCSSAFSVCFFSSFALSSFSFVVVARTVPGALATRITIQSIAAIRLPARFIKIHPSRIAFTSPA